MTNFGGGYFWENCQHSQRKKKNGGGEGQEELKSLKMKFLLYKQPSWASLRRTLFPQM